MEHWQIEKEKSDKVKKIKNLYPDFGKIVKYEGEVGLVVFNPKWKLEDERPDYNPNTYTDAYSVRWDSNDERDYEQYGSFDYEYLAEYEFKNFDKKQFLEQSLNKLL